MNDIDWSVFENNASGLFVKWQTVGDHVSGTITRVYTREDMNGNPKPALDIDTDTGPRTVTCSQANLFPQIVSAKPATGDHITITFTGEEKAAMGSRKVFTVELTRSKAVAKAPF